LGEHQVDEYGAVVALYFSLVSGALEAGSRAYQEERSKK
jgi:hypothetical protein